MEELKQLKELNLKKKNSLINKKTKATFKVIIEVIDGIFYLQGEAIFEISKKENIDKTRAGKMLKVLYQTIEEQEKETPVGSLSL